MRKVIISAIVVLSLALAMGAYGVTQDTATCCGNASGAAGNMSMGSMGGCCGMHNDMIAIMASMIDVQKDLVATMKDSPKKQELQKKVSEMESLLKQVMREQNSQNCCGGGMMQNMPMQNMPDNMPMKNMPMYNPPAKK